MRRNGVVVQWTREADVLEHILRGASRVVAVFAIHCDTVAIDQLEERHHSCAQLAHQVLVVVEAATDACEALKEIAMRNGPFASALAAEDTEDLAAIVRQGLLPFHVIPASERMCRGKADRTRVVAAE